MCLVCCNAKCKNVKQEVSLKKIIKANGVLLSKSKEQGLTSLPQVLVSEYRSDVSPVTTIRLLILRLSLIFKIFVYAYL